jgi:hypothetical protein
VNANRWLFSRFFSGFFLTNRRNVIYWFLSLPVTITTINSDKWPFAILPSKELSKKSNDFEEIGDREEFRYYSQGSGFWF